MGLCPLQFGPRIRRAAVVREGAVVQVKSSIHNVAFPRFVCPVVAPGAEVVVRGMGPELRFSLPAEPVVAITRVGDTEHRDPLRIDQIGIEPGLGRFFVTYRYTFIYPLRPGDVRRCELTWQPGPSAILPSLEAAPSAET